MPAFLFPDMNTFFEKTLDVRRRERTSDRTERNWGKGDYISRGTRNYSEQTRCCTFDGATDAELVITQ